SRIFDTQITSICTQRTFVPAELSLSVRSAPLFCCTVAVRRLKTFSGWPRTYRSMTLRFSRRRPRIIHGILILFLHLLNRTNPGFLRPLNFLRNLLTISIRQGFPMTASTLPDFHRALAWHWSFPRETQGDGVASQRLPVG